MATSGTVAAGDTVLATQYNNLRSDAFVTSASVTKNAALSANDNTETHIEFNVENHDNGTHWTAGGSGTPPTGAKLSYQGVGLYRVRIQCFDPVIRRSTDTFTLKAKRDNTTVETRTLKFGSDDFKRKIWVPSQEWNTMDTSGGSANRGPDGNEIWVGPCTYNVGSGGTPTNAGMDYWDLIDTTNANTFAGVFHIAKMPDMPATVPAGDLKWTVYFSNTDIACLLRVAKTKTSGTPAGNGGNSDLTDNWQDSGTLTATHSGGQATAINPASQNFAGALTDMDSAVCFMVCRSPSSSGANPRFHGAEFEYTPTPRKSVTPEIDFYYYETNASAHYWNFTVTVDDLESTATNTGTYDASLTRLGGW